MVNGEHFHYAIRAAVEHFAGDRLHPDDPLGVHGQTEVETDS